MEAGTRWNVGEDSQGNIWLIISHPACVIHLIMAHVMAQLHQGWCEWVARVLALEDPQRWGGLIDLPSGGASTEQIVRAFSSGEPEVAVRDRLLVPRLAPREASRTGPPRADGSWLVTGGFGALGSAVARFPGPQPMDQHSGSRFRTD